SLLSSAVALQRSKSEQSGGSTRLSHKQQGKRPETAIEGQEHQGHNVEDAAAAAAATAGPSRVASVRRRRHSSSSSLLSSPAGSHDLNFGQSTQPPDWRHRFGEDIEILDSDGQWSQHGSANTPLSSLQRPHLERTRSQPMITSTSLPGFSSSSSSHIQLPNGGHNVGPIPRALVHDDNSPSLEFSDSAFFANRDHHRQHSYSHSSPQSPSSFSSPPHLHHNRRPSRFSSTHVRSSRDRVPIARSALALLGGSELGRKSGAAGGIRATSLSGSATGSEMDSDEFEEEDGEGQRYGGHARRKASRRMRGRGRGLGMGMGMGMGLLRTDMYHASEMEDELGSGASGHRRTEVQARFGSRTSDTSRRGPGDVGSGSGSGSGRRISKHQARHHQHQQQHHQYQHHYHRHTDSDHEAEGPSRVDEADADDHLMMDLGRLEDDSPSRDGAADRSSRAQGPTSTGMVSQNHPETGVSSSSLS
ncbi:hypothetical protein CF326_g9692, partial [Tilletia indica]